MRTLMQCCCCGGIYISVSFSLSDRELQQRQQQQWHNNISIQNAVLSIQYVVVGKGLKTCAPQDPGPPFSLFLKIKKSKVDKFYIVYFYIEASISRSLGYFFVKKNLLKIFSSTAYSSFFSAARKDDDEEAEVPWIFLERHISPHFFSSSHCKGFPVYYFHSESREGVHGDYYTCTFNHCLALLLLLTRFFHKVSLQRLKYFRSAAQCFHFAFQSSEAWKRCLHGYMFIDISTTCIKRHKEKSYSACLIIPLKTLFSFFISVACFSHASPYIILSITAHTHHHTETWEKGPGSYQLFVCIYTRFLSIGNMAKMHARAVSSGEWADEDEKGNVCWKMWCGPIFISHALKLPTVACSPLFKMQYTVLVLSFSVLVPTSRERKTRE